MNVKAQSLKHFEIWALDLICHLNFIIWHFSQACFTPPNAHHYQH